MRPLITLILIICINTLVNSQNQYKYWHFGPTSKGFYFDANLNKIVTNNSYTPYTGEGCSVMTHPISGVLQFYTDGSVVVDRNHQPMPNGSGLTNNQSSFGKANFCPVPNSCTQFYVFHNNDYEQNSGNLYYSIIDMSLIGNGNLSNPLGDVVNGQKNILIHNNVSEAIEVIAKPNSHDYWLLIPLNSSSIRVYSITSLGITFINSYSLISSLTDIRGFRYSNLSEKLCVLSMVENQASIIADFDPVTGVISNQFIIPGTPMGNSTNWWEGMYDAEWSPDGNKLYISKYRVSSPASGGKIYQYDLLNQSANPVLVHNAGSQNIMVAKGLQIGPDNKIYFMTNTSGGTTQILGEISNPNNSGITCNILTNSLDMGSTLGQVHLFPKFLEFVNTLPPVSDSVYNYSLVNCFPFNDTAIINLNLIFNFIDNENDGLIYTIANPGSSSFILGNNLNYIRPTSATVSDTLFIQICDDYCYALCDTFKLILNFDPNSGGTSLNIPPQFSGCEGDTITIDGGTPGLSYMWSTGETTQIIQTLSSGLITVEAYDVNGCIYTDTTNVILFDSPIINLGPDQSICEGVLLTVSDPNFTVVWNGTLQSDSLFVSSTGLQIVEVTDQNGCTESDSIFVTINQITPLVLGSDSTICENDSIQLNYNLTGYDSYLWSDGSTQSSFSISDTGTYFVTVSDNGCFDSDSIIIIGNPAPYFSFGPTYSGCSLTLRVDYPNSTFLWSTGSTENIIYIFNSGTYFLTVTNSFGCSVTDSLDVVITSVPGYFSYVPNVFSPNNDGINDVFKIAGQKDECYDKLSVEIYNRWGQLLFSSDVPEFEWNGKDLENKEVPDGVYYVLLNGIFGGEDISRSHTVTLLR